MSDAADIASEIEQQRLDRAMQAHFQGRAAAATPVVIKGKRRCLDCDVRIDPKRIKANPAAVRCTECQGFYEREHRE